MSLLKLNEKMNKNKTRVFKLPVPKFKIIPTTFDYLWPHYANLANINCLHNA